MTLGDVYAAQAYYCAHNTAIDSDMVEDEPYAEALRRTGTSKLRLHTNSNR